jgi:hypothetical protein
MANVLVRTILPRGAAKPVIRLGNNAEVPLHCYKQRNSRTTEMLPSLMTSSAEAQ